MDLFNVLQSLDTAKYPHVKEFDYYTLIKAMGTASQQGKVLLAENPVKRQYAIKFYTPKSVSDTLVKGVDDFYREVHMTILLNHKNVVKVHTAGRAKWDGEHWSVKEGIDTSELVENELLFFVMDYINGPDLSEMSANLTKEKFEDMCYQVMLAFEYIHNSGVTHKDIKPANIKYSEQDNNFILVDFGMARPSTYEARGPTQVITEFEDSWSLKAQRDKESPFREKAPKLNDLGQFALVLRKLLPQFRSEYDSARYKGISDCINRATQEDLGNRFPGASEFKQALLSYFITIHPWKFDLKLNEFLCSQSFPKFQFCTRLRIPVSGSVLLPGAVKSIVDTPEFQRLRGTKQLGPTSFVFPGANHTRFEHSIGTYYLSLRYIESLFNLPNFREICEPINEAIKEIALSALLHDIGHYPFSHWIEEINPLPNGMHIPKHEDRAKEIISGSKIASIIKDEWGTDLESIYRIIANDIDENSTNKEILIHSIIDSIIGIDRVDYLMRDSIHCGVDYGQGIDLDRLLNSLYVCRRFRSVATSRSTSPSACSLV